MHLASGRIVNCPLPVLRTKKALAALPSDEILKVTATDPGSVKDLASFWAQTGNEMLSNWEADGGFHSLIRRA